jgi:hypothetical protein
VIVNMDKTMQLLQSVLLIVIRQPQKFHRPSSHREDRRNSHAAIIDVEQKGLDERLMANNSI